MKRHNGCVRLSKGRQFCIWRNKRHPPARVENMSTHVLYTDEKNGSNNHAHGEIGWISFEAAAALRLLDNLQIQLGRLDKKLSKTRVHDSRVAIRRWFAIWNILREDGWEGSKFRKQASEPLATLLTHLGKTRDMDVMLELGSQLGCKRKFLRDLDRHRAKAARELEQHLRKLSINSLIRYMHSSLQRRKLKLEKALFDTLSARESIADHINFALEHQEQLVKSLESMLDTPKGMHEFRLGVKGWRYLLSELCGIKNEELGEAQTLLGEIHDLDTMHELLLEDGNNILALENLRHKRNELLSQAQLITRQLPYGLRAVGSIPAR